MQSLAFKAAMRLVPAAVTVVSTSHAGRQYGLTATAVCSVSADPPQLLVCVNRDGRAHGHIVRAGHFGVNYLGHEQAALARVFATPDLAPDQRFASGDWTTGEHGVPLLRDAMVAFECRTVQAVECSTHTIFIGEVLDGHSHEAPSLLYRLGEFSHA